MAHRGRRCRIDSFVVEEQTFNFPRILTTFARTFCTPISWRMGADRWDLSDLPGISRSQAPGAMKQPFWVVWCVFVRRLGVSQRLIAIGDIHGCRTALELLLDAIGPTGDDIIVTLGDYVDRGPDSKGVIDTLIQLGKTSQVVGLLGNHEEMMLEVVRGEVAHHSWLRYGGVETLDSYGFDGDLDFLPPDHVDFFAALGDYFTLGDYFFTHAAYDPDEPLESQGVEMLRWYSLNDGLPGPHRSGKTAVVGHTAMKNGEILDAGHLLCLDTYCYGGGWLTALDLMDRHLWQASEEGQVREA